MITAPEGARGITRVSRDLVQQRLEALAADVARLSSIGTIGARRQQHTEGLREAGWPARADEVVE